MLQTLRDVAAGLGVSVGYDPATNTASVGGISFTPGDAISQSLGLAFDPKTEKHYVTDLGRFSEAVGKSTGTSSKAPGAGAVSYDGALENTSGKIVSVPVDSGVESTPGTTFGNIFPKDPSQIQIKSNGNFGNYVAFGAIVLIALKLLNSRR